MDPIDPIDPRKDTAIARTVAKVMNRELASVRARDTHDVVRDSILSMGTSRGPTTHPLLSAPSAGGAPLGVGAPRAISVSGGIPHATLG